MDLLDALKQYQTAPAEKPQTLLETLDASLKVIEQEKKDADVPMPVVQVGRELRPADRETPVHEVRPTVEAKGADVAQATEEYRWPHPFHFVNGAAGSGKTWLTRDRVAASAPNSCVVMASTGIAAVNLGDAVTINSQLGYFDTSSMQQNYTHGILQQRLRRLRQAGVRRLILDEVSMFEAEQLTCLVRAINELNSEAGTSAASVNYFDDTRQSQELGLTLVGDFCFSPETEVTSADGSIVQVSDLKVGMQLMGPDGTARTVTHLSQGFGPRYLVKQGNGRDYVVSENHLVVLKRGKNGQRLEWSGLRYSAHGDTATVPAKLLARKSRKFRECFVGYRAGCIPLPSRGVLIDPYFLGLWLGDGHKDSPRVTTADPEVVDYCRDYATRLGLDLRVTKERDTKAVRVALTHGRDKGHVPNVLWTGFRHYDLENNKHIPADYLLNTEGVRLAVLAGLLDSDGCWSGNRYTITLCRRQLVVGLRQLAEQLGFRVSENSAAAGWCLNISGDTWRIPCRIPRKQSRLRRLGRDRLISVLTVLPLRDGEFAGFGLTGDQMFLLADGTVAHNCQLPPIKGKYAFQSPEWHHFDKGIETLTEIRRQGNEDFINALRACRAQDVDHVCDYFRSFISMKQDNQYSGTTIFAKNDSVERMNKTRLDELPGSSDHYQNARSGKERGEWKHIPLTLDLKPNAQVMILSNRYEERELLYANGDAGVYLGKNGSGDAMVQLSRTGEATPVKWITRQNKLARKDAHYVCANPQCNTPASSGHVKRCPVCGSSIKKDLYEIVGEITYMPLRLAYARTVHKTQGLTLETVQIAIGDHFFTSYGMLYVALSRARGPEGLKLVGTIDQLRKRVRMDPAVAGWR